MSRVVWTATALTGLVYIRAYIGQFNPHAAARVAASLRAAGESLAQFPRRGRPVSDVDGETREFIAEYPYIIRYRIMGDDVVILRVRHGARRPTDF